MLEWLATRVEFVCLDTLWFCIVCSVPRYDLQSFALGSPLPTLSLSKSRAGHLAYSDPLALYPIYFGQSSIRIALPNWSIG